MERGGNVTVLYRLKATVARSRIQGSSRHVGSFWWLAMTLKQRSVETTIAYIPRIVPDMPSPARQLMYQERAPLIEPSDDPEGWHTLQAVTIRGTMFGDRAVEFTCVVRFPLFVSSHRVLMVCS